PNNNVRLEIMRATIPKEIDERTLNCLRAGSCDQGMSYSFFPGRDRQINPSVFKPVARIWPSGVQPAYRMSPAKSVGACLASPVFGSKILTCQYQVVASSAVVTRIFPFVISSAAITLP